MGIKSLRAWILAASLLSVSAVAGAAGLGKINVTSALGEPLAAEIELLAEKNEVGSLAARLAGPEAFERAGLIYSGALKSVKVSVEKRPSGEPYVHLTSSQPMTEPFIDLLVELSWASGRISREFTALLDPPEVIAQRQKQATKPAEVRAAPPAPEPKAVPVPEPAKPAPKPEPAAEAPSKAAPPTAPEQPSAAQAPAAPTPAPSAPSAPVETIGGTAPTLFDQGSARPSKAAALPSSDAYGPVKSGDTLGKIARATKPADVSLEQMLVLLFRSNPDAFAGKNMNRLKTGRIIQMPTGDQFGSISGPDARKEVLAQARDFNAYREQLAAAAGQTPEVARPAEQSAAGKVTTTVQDKAAPAKEAPKEVLKLSKSEAPAAGAAPAGTAGGAGSATGKATQERVRALEEELVARDKSVKEANDRVAKLEKTIKDLQALLEMKNKGAADLQKQAAPAAPAVPQAPAKPQAAAPQAAPTPPSKPGVATPPAPAAPTVAPAVTPAPVAPAKPATPGSEAKPVPAPAPATPGTPAPKSESAPATAQPAPPKPKTTAKPMPAPEPGFVDQILDHAVYIAVGLGALALIGGLAVAVRAVKRRRESKAQSEEAGPAKFGPAAGASAGMAMAAAGAAAAESQDQAVASEEVDPVAEAEIFLAYGRDAQAEELLTEAMSSSPHRYEVHLKLLQIYAKRKDTKNFEKVAREMQQGTGGSGPLWSQAVALGYQTDPENPRYAAGKGLTGTTAAPAANAAENVDFNVGFEDSNAATTTDIDLGDSSFEKTQIIDPTSGGSHVDTTVLEPEHMSTMNLNVDLPVTEQASEPQAGTSAKSAGSALNFDIDLNSLSMPVAEAGTKAEPASAAGGGGLDFDMSGLSLEMPSESKVEPAAAPEIDLSGISLDLGTETAPQQSPTGKDDHWYDVQTKFDLAKAYQEMGDKDGAREILKEVLQEGDAEQKTAAQAVLSSLGV